MASPFWMLLCRLPGQLEQVSIKLTTALFTLADAVPVDPAVVTDTVSNKRGGFLGPLAALFEGSLKVRSQQMHCHINS